MPLTSRPQGRGSVNPTERLWTRWESNPGLKKLPMHPLRACLSFLLSAGISHSATSPVPIYSFSPCDSRQPLRPARVFIDSSYPDILAGIHPLPFLRRRPGGPRRWPRSSKQEAQRLSWLLYHGPLFTWQLTNHGSRLLLLLLHRSQVGPGFFFLKFTTY